MIKCKKMREKKTKKMIKNMNKRMRKKTRKNTRILKKKKQMIQAKLINQFILTQLN